MTFQVAGAVKRAHAEEASPPQLVEFTPHETLIGTPPEEGPAERPNLSVGVLSVRECLSADAARPGGTLVIPVRNTGAGRTGGFRLYIGVTLARPSTGASSTQESQFWISNLAPQQDATFEVPFSYPLHAGNPQVASGVPLPGPYDATARLDNPRALDFLGPEGVIVESDESDNAASTSVAGMPVGAC